MNQNAQKAALNFSMKREKPQAEQKFVMVTAQKISTSWLFNYIPFCLSTFF